MKIKSKNRNRTTNRGYCNQRCVISVNIEVSHSEALYYKIDSFYASSKVDKCNKSIKISRFSHKPQYPQDETYERLIKKHEDNLMKIRMDMANYPQIFRILKPYVTN